MCDRLSVGHLSQEIQPSWWPVSSQMSDKNQASEFLPETVIPGLAWR